MKKILLIIGFGILTSAVLWRFAGGLSQPDSEKSAPAQESHQEGKIVKLTPEQIKTLGIIVQEAAPGQLSLTLSARGKIILHPDRLAHIYPKVTGVAREAMKNIGDEVQQGEVLAVIESREMADIKANYLAAIEKEKLARAFLERERRLNDKKISAEVDYLNALSAYEEARIKLQLTQQQLHAFGLTDQDFDAFSTGPDPDLRGYAIRAPIDGTILNRHITKGEYIDNTAMIYEMADLSHVWVEIGIYPNDLAKVKEGQIVQVTLPVEGVTSEAKIIYVSPIVEDETIISKAVALLCNFQRNWRPGTFVTVSIDTENIQVPVAVPHEAVQEMEGESFVFVQVPEGFEKRAVRRGKSDVAAVELISGIHPGEKFAAAKSFLLKAEMGKDDVEDDD